MTKLDDGDEEDVEDVEDDEGDEADDGSVAGERNADLQNEPTAIDNGNASEDEPTDADGEPVQNEPTGGQSATPELLAAIVHPLALPAADPAMIDLANLRPEDVPARQAPPSADAGFYQRMPRRTARRNGYKR